MRFYFFLFKVWCRLKGYRWKQGRKLEYVREGYRLLNDVFLNENFIKAPYPLPNDIPYHFANCFLITHSGRTVGTLSLAHTDEVNPVYFDLYKELKKISPDLSGYMDLSRVAVHAEYRDASQTVFMLLLLLAYAYTRKQKKQRWIFSTSQEIYFYLRRYNPQMKIISKKPERFRKDDPMQVHYENYEQDFLDFAYCYDFPLDGIDFKKIFKKLTKTSWKKRKKNSSS